MKSEENSGEEAEDMKELEMLNLGAKAFSACPSDSVQSSSDQIFKCPFEGCNKIFRRRIRLNAHMHLHYGTQPFKCEFPGCDKSFSEKQNLKIHQRIHADERPFPCP